jgi:hypothetical protein
VAAVFLDKGPLLLERNHIFGEANGQQFVLIRPLGEIHRVSLSAATTRPGT